jgi:hypothetical protein
VPRRRCRIRRATAIARWPGTARYRRWASSGAAVEGPIDPALRGAHVGDVGVDGIHGHRGGAAAHGVGAGGGLAVGDGCRAHGLPVRGRQAKGSEGIQPESLLGLQRFDGGGARVLGSPFPGEWGAPVLVSAPERSEVLALVDSFQEARESGPDSPPGRDLLRSEGGSSATGLGRPGGWPPGGHPCRTLGEPVPLDPSPQYPLLPVRRGLVVTRGDGPRPALPPPAGRFQDTPSPCPTSGARSVLRRV